jgi:hypothetical protein
MKAVKVNWRLISSKSQDWSRFRGPLVRGKLTIMGI